MGQKTISDISVRPTKHFLFICFIFFIRYSRPILGHYRRDGLTHSMLITTFHCILTRKSPESSNKVGFLSSPELLVEFEPGTFQFDCNALTHQAFPSCVKKSCDPVFFPYYDSLRANLAKDRPQFLLVILNEFKRIN